MPFNVPTLRQLIESGLIDIEASLDTVLPKFGIEQALNSAVSGSIRDLYDYQTWIVRQIIPSTESEDQTIIDTARYEGVIQKLASNASGSVSFSGSAPIPVDTVMTHSDGRLYRVTLSNAPSGGSVTVDVEAEEAGAAGNLAQGETLTLVSTVPGVQPNGISDGITGGADVESVSSVLERLLFRKRNPPMGGAVHDYVAWCREVPGVSRAWAEDNYQGPATVGFAFVFDDRVDILPTYQEQVAMADYIYRHSDPATGTDVGRPGGIEAVYIPLQLKTTDMNILISPDTAELRQSVRTSIEGYFRTLSPGSTLLLSSVRTAIGSTTGIADYTLDLDQDVPALENELHELGVITWGTP
ncbi:baseplate J/gp47 family protein [Vibrio parahaemolyticus]|uniref:baseplate J/gp47 family protein n=1 Tax=Vibrio parahaemolyticus TaxID=670 RepID=UPI0028DF6720|nr:baseplate J/gp47 family protein [Vibrio parahaemolyticus]MDT8844805.1 baseplate J/gp47 family protein [Vibrio parahaemolyticus]MDT8917165.1 baseplate J/gp47 family protein [Vibrio parahaemolyticus]